MNQKCILLICLFVMLSISSALAKPNNNATNKPIYGKSVQHDRSKPLSQLLEISKNRTDLDDDLKAPGYIYPNVTILPDGLYPEDSIPSEIPDIQNKRKGSNPAPIIDLSFNGISQADTGGGLPPDTNGDVGLQYYVQYINTDWAIFDKTNGTRIGNVNQGNSFWAGFGGACQGHNAGDPIVLFDKIAKVWVFSQFTNLHFDTTTNNVVGAQCFAVSDRSDLMDPDLTFYRYKFNFQNAFNDYPHIGIWTDSEGKSSGYYLTTNDFTTAAEPSYIGTSFSVVERDKMLIGEEAQFIRFPDVRGFGSQSYGALPAHLESEVLPQGNTCAPFIHAKYNLNAYLVWLMCVDWDTIDNSYLTTQQKIDASTSFSSGGFNNRIKQPAPAPAGSELDTLSNSTMYRVSARAYPPETDLPVEIVANHSIHLGSNQFTIRWVDMSLTINNQYDLIHGNGFEVPEAEVPLYTIEKIDEGVLPAGTDSRWMGAISIDQSGNLGLAYSVSSETTFPSVHYTGRLKSDAAGVMQDEQVCVAGGGVQTYVDSQGSAGRWGDYSSISVDPVDQCTFWATVEYKSATGMFNWENRICTFKHPTCGQAELIVRTDSDGHYNICTEQTPNVDLNISVFPLGNPLITNVDFSTLALPGGVTASFSGGSNQNIPVSTVATIDNLNLAGINQFSFDIQVESTTPPTTKTKSFSMTVSNAIPAAPTLLIPVNSAVEQELLIEFQWDNILDALSYTIEIASDNNFNTVIETADTTSNSYTSTVHLSANTQYYWRVKSINNCGESITSVVSNFTTGIPGSCPSGTNTNTVFFDDLEGDVSDWTLPVATIGTNTWAISGSRVNSGTTSFFAIDNDTESDQLLISPSITIPSASEAPITLSYWNFQAIETNTGSGANACWDAAILEISTDGGSSYVQISNDKLLTDLYDGDITTGVNPLSGLQGWCGSDTQTDQATVSIVDLISYAGQTVQFRFRIGTDAAAADEGWYIDDVEVKSCITP